MSDLKKERIKFIRACWKQGMKAPAVFAYGKKKYWKGTAKNSAQDSIRYYFRKFRNESPKQSNGDSVRMEDLLNNQPGATNSLLQQSLDVSDSDNFDFTELPGNQRGDSPVDSLPVVFWRGLAIPGNFALFLVNVAVVESFVWNVNDKHTNRIDLKLEVPCPTVHFMKTVAQLDVEDQALWDTSVIELGSQKVIKLNEMQGFTADEVKGIKLSKPRFKEAFKVNAPKGYKFPKHLHSAAAHDYVVLDSTAKESELLRKIYPNYEKWFRVWKLPLLSSEKEESTTSTTVARNISIQD
mmetsp:Transcript_6197/g.9661  ORF Transcript_6197/g.9661 Transcript_6197/m.9661 type:complete len:296 (+) Transcript_6197:424-1311(+)